MIDSPLPTVLLETRRVQAVPVESGSFLSRKPLPEPWRGIRDAELSALSGIEDCVFGESSWWLVAWCGGGKRWWWCGGDVNPPRRSDVSTL